ncbi:MAG: hypothetical protein ABFD63_15340 [Smithella sp.]|jgi:hypothetical protein
MKSLLSVYIPEPYATNEYSPSYRVSFNPERKAAESILIKYEWRETLCKKEYH